MKHDQCVCVCVGVCVCVDECALVSAIRVHRLVKRQKRKTSGTFSYFGFSFFLVFLFSFFFLFIPRTALPSNMKSTWPDLQRDGVACILQEMKGKARGAGGDSRGVEPPHFAH